MNNPTEAEIRTELELILGSIYFRQSRLLQKFLRFIVERTLEGRGNEIKEYTVGIEVLNRSKGFNAQQDGSVRIHAVRLRKMLNAWYEDKGNQSQVRIMLEKGNYQPIFIFHNNSQTNYTSITQMGKKGNYLLKEKFFILPFECYVSSQEDAATVMDGFCAELSESLSYFEDVSVISWYISSRFVENGGDVERIGEYFEVSYLISGGIKISETDVTITVYLNEPSDPMPIWSQIFSQSIENQSIFEIIREISEQIISMLVDYNGYVHVHRFGARDFASLPSNKTSLAIFWFYHFVTRNTSEIYFEALRHLEQAVKEDPNSPMAWAILGHLQINGVIYGYVNGTEPLELSKVSIEKALMLNPDSQHGLIGLSLLKILKGDTAEASNLLRRCIAINPNSGYFQATVSLGFTLVGNYKDAIELLKKAYGSNAIPIWWLSISEYLEALVSGDYKSAFQLAPSYHAAAGILQHVFEFIALYHLGEQDSFENLVKEYDEKYPDGIKHIKDQLIKLFHDPKAQEKLKVALDAAADYIDLQAKI